MAARSWDPRQPRIATHSGGFAPQILYDAYEANSQSFKAGSLVYLNAGAVTVAAGGDVPIAGIAMKDATNVTSGNIEIPVQMITPDDEVLIQVSTGGTLQAANTTCAPGVAYDIVLDSNSEFWTLDSADTTNPKFVFIGPVLDATGAATYWAKVRLYATESELWHL